MSMVNPFTCISSLRWSTWWYFWMAIFRTSFLHHYHRYCAAQIFFFKVETLFTRTHKRMRRGGGDEGTVPPPSPHPKKNATVSNSGKNRAIFGQYSGKIGLYNFGGDGKKWCWARFSDLAWIRDSGKTGKTVCAPPPPPPKKKWSGPIRLDARSCCCTFLIPILDIDDTWVRALEIHSHLHHECYEQYQTTFVVRRHVECIHVSAPTL